MLVDLASLMHFFFLKDGCQSLTDVFESPHGASQAICHSVGKTQTGRDSEWPAAISEDRPLW